MADQQSAQTSVADAFAASHTNRSENVTINPTPQRPPASIVERYRALEDATGTISDALDVLGIRGCIAASELMPRLPGSCIAGPAITVRNVPESWDPFANVTHKTSRFAAGGVHKEAQAQPGDVLVIQGPANASNMGGNLAELAQRTGEVGLICDGAIRDVQHYRRVGFPSWTRAVTPVSGKWRMAKVEVNGVVTIAGITVRPGDMVVADDSGVAFIPQGVAERVLEICEEWLAREKGQ
jgi:regulator of RNase E activity RraA